MSRSAWGTALIGMQYRILKAFFPLAPDCARGRLYEGKSKLEVLCGRNLGRFSGKFIIDFGCGNGVEAIEIARLGAKRIIGIDNRETVLQEARRRARIAGVEEICHFMSSTNELADMIVSIDAFEHFQNPAGVLNVMEAILKPEGEVVASFGPTWYHPLGGHLFSVFPWAHLFFSEPALLQWRSGFKEDGATRFSEVEGGLNQMSIARFRKLIEESPFQFASFELVPIKRLSFAHIRWTREFTTAIVRCRLVKRSASASLANGWS